MRPPYGGGTPGASLNARAEDGSVVASIDGDGAPRQLPRLDGAPGSEARNTSSPPAFGPSAGAEGPRRAVGDSSSSFSSSQLTEPSVADRPRPEGSLGNPARHVSADDGKEETRRRRRSERGLLRYVLWGVSELPRVRRCGKVPTGDTVVAMDNGGVAHFAGLQSCGSIWACPVCSAKIRNVRSEEIAGAAGKWDRDGNTVLMVTLTAPHDMGMALKPLLEVIAGSFRQVIAGRPWLRVKKQVGIVGTIRAVEVTHGENGWHPHLHVLVFVKGDPGAEGLAALTSIFVRSGVGQSSPPDTGLRLICMA